MWESFTAGALRALERAQVRARQRGSIAVEPRDLLAALTDEAESRAGELLAAHGLDPLDIRRALGAVEEPPPSETLDPQGELDSLPHSQDLRSALSDAMIQARSYSRTSAVGTEHLLTGLLAASGPVAELLAEAGLELPVLVERLRESEPTELGPIPLAAEIPPLELTEPSQAVDLGRILDAAGNRAREGLRVVEDYVRFVLDDQGLTRRLKEVRHRLAEALRGLDPQLLINARNTQEDVGTHIMTVSERVRENPRAVLTANFKRTGEALRSLEEYVKLVNVWLAGRFEVLRYDVYTLEKMTLTAVAAAQALGESRLMVLVGGLATLGDLTWIVGEALAGGADVIQLREKGLPDRDWLRRAREVRILTAQAGARFVVNDRADLARLAGADAVHLGQDDLTVRDARRIVGPAMTIGVSAHDRAMMDRAVLDGAGYLGIGPVFPSATKDFSDLAGLAFVLLAAETTTLPWFAIGGITEGNVDEVILAGASRIAVSAAVVRADRPRRAAARLRARLEGIEPEPEPAADPRVQ